MAGHVENTEKPETATAVNDVKLDSIGIKQEELVSAGKIAADEEVNMSIWEVFKLYPKTRPGRFCCQRLWLWKVG